MKLRPSAFAAFLCSGLWLPQAFALPQDFGDLSDLLGAGGGLFSNDVIVDGRDLTDGFLQETVWSGEKKLPGSWKDAYETGSREIRHITKSPYLFGHVPIGVEASYDEKALERVSIYYLEAGTFYGYQPELKDTKEGVDLLRQKRRMFRKAFNALEKSLAETLKDITKNRGSMEKEGRTNFFKSYFKQYVLDDRLAIQLRTADDFFVRVDLTPLERVSDGYLDPEIDSLKKRERAGLLSDKVKTTPNGDVKVEEVPMIFQGGRAYCGITTFLMVAQHLGIQLDPATVASVAGFQFGMGGKKLIEAYSAAAKEGNLRMSRNHKFDFERAKKSIDAGLPVLVWRKFDPHRNRIHTQRHHRERARGHLNVSLPEPTPEDRATWPGANHPNHASVITGYHPEKNEVIFSESWGEHARDKRMRAEELEGTSYMVFYFRL